MEISSYYPYRSEAARDFCVAYLDSLAVSQRPIASEDRVVPKSYGATFVRVGGPASGSPLVLLHGAATTSLMWAPNIQALSAEYRTFAVDQISEFGKSTCAKPVLSITDLLAWLGELFDGLALRADISLAGLSYGGGLAAQYALRFPGRLKRIALLAPRGHRPATQD
jgi:pimeloyl-ACP methyl ester carboxylesterase